MSDQLRWGCARCGVEAGQRCRNRSGKPRRLNQTHAGRVDVGERAMAALAQFGQGPRAPFRSYDWYGGAE